jgi:hypothetical protein
VKTSRSAVSAALFNLLSSITWLPIGSSTPVGFATLGRRVRIWTDVSPDQQPALFMQKLDEQIMQDQAYGATRYLLHYRLWVYLRADASSDPTTNNEDLFDPVLDALDKAINASGYPPFYVPQRLAGLVENVWIDGRIDLDPGQLDQQVVATIPISVVCGL